MATTGNGVESGAAVSLSPSIFVVDSRASGPKSDHGLNRSEGQPASRYPVAARVCNNRVLRYSSAGQIGVRIRAEILFASRIYKYPHFPFLGTGPSTFPSFSGKWERSVRVESFASPENYVISNVRGRERKNSRATTPELLAWSVGR